MKATFKSLGKLGALVLIAMGSVAYAANRQDEPDPDKALFALIDNEWVEISHSQANNCTQNPLSTCTAQFQDDSNPGVGQPTYSRSGEYIQ